MNKKRCAIIEFDLIDLLSKYDAFDIGEILQSLPEDTKVISFGNEFNRATLSMVIQSSVFKETDLAELLPKIEVKEDEEGHLITDYDNVIDKSLKDNLIISNVDKENGIVWFSNPINDEWVENYKKWEKVAVDSILYGTSTFKWDYITKSSCDHSWSHYEGLMETYNYCSKCGEKET